MVDTALDVISLSRARFELRVPEGDRSQDESLRELIASAVSEVEKDLSVILVNRFGSIPLALAGEGSWSTDWPFLHSIHEVRYQRPSEAAIPGLYDVTLPAADYRFERGRNGGPSVLRSAAEWPEAAFRRFLVTAIVGSPSDAPAFPAYQSAAILVMRSLYDGVAVIRPDSAYDRLTTPLRRYSPAPLEFSFGGFSSDQDAGEREVQIRIGWNTAPVATEEILTQGYKDDNGDIPDAADPAPRQYLVIWRSDAFGGDPEEVHIAGGGNQRNIFRDAAALAVAGVSGHAIVSVTTQRVPLLSRENVRIV